MAKLLLENGAQVDIQGCGGWSALMIVSLTGHLKISKLLLDYGAQVDLQQKGGGSARMMANQGGHFEVTQLLLNNGAQVDMQAMMVEGVPSLLPVILGMIK